MAEQIKAVDLDELAKTDPALAEALLGASAGGDETTAQEAAPPSDQPSDEQVALQKLNDELDAQDEQVEAEVKAEDEAEAEVEADADADAEADAENSVDFSAGSETQAEAIRSQQLRDRQKLIHDAQDELNQERAKHTSNVAANNAARKSFKQLSAEGPVVIGGARTPHSAES